MNVSHEIGVGGIVGLFGRLGVRGRGGQIKVPGVGFHTPYPPLCSRMMNSISGNAKVLTCLP